jgi:heptosyltransferase III
MTARNTLDRLDRSRVTDILILLRNNQIGDMLCSQPLYTAIRRGFPAAAITVLAAPTNYPVPLRDINPCIDHVEHYDRSLLRSLLMMPGFRRKRRYQIGIVPSTVKVSFSLHLLNWLAGPRIRVGIRSLDGVLNPARGLLNCAGDVAWNTPLVHQRRRNRDIARLLGCDIADEELFDNMITVREEDRVAAAARLRQEGIPDDALIIGIHPGAGEPARMWPLERFAELCALLNAERPARFVMMPGPIDSDLIPPLRREFQSRALDLHILPDLTIRELPAMLAHLRLLVTNDTGLLHIAAAVGTPIVSLMLADNVHVWLPQLPHVHPCISTTGSVRDIDARDVFDRCRETLATHSTELSAGHGA